MSSMRRKIDVEKLLHWTYQEELPKREISAAEGIWDQIAEGGWLFGGPKKPGHKSGLTAQRYACHGLPHPDAGKVANAVGRLPDIAIDWEWSAQEMLGNTAALLSEIDVLQIRPVNTSAVVTMHGITGRRPDWKEEPPRPRPIPASNGRGYKLVGECTGRNRYAYGTYCPMKWFPSPISIAQARSDYAAWFSGLCMLVETLHEQLDQFEPTGPAAPGTPWQDQKINHQVFHVGEVGKRLPLKQQRPVAGPATTRPTYRTTQIRIAAS